MYVYSPLLFYTLQLFGLLPFSVHRLPLGRQVVTLSRPLVYYSYVIVAIFLTSFGMWIHEGFYEESNDSPLWTNLLPKTSIVTIVSGTCFGLATAVVCELKAVFSAEKRIQLLEKLQEIDFQLQRRAVPANTHHVSSITLTCVLGLLAFDIHVQHSSLFTYNTVFLVHRVILVITILEFAELVLNIQDRFRLVNERTLEVVRRSRYKQEVWTIALPAVETFSTPQEQSMSISSVNQAHWDLCCLISDINDLYGLQLTVITGQIFYNLVSYNFALYLVFQLDVNLYFCAAILGWMLMFLGQIVILAWPCSQTVAEARKTTAIVAKLMGSKIGQSMKAELEVFIKQLFLRDVEFSVNGFFTLQTPVVLPIVGAVTTYLAVIIQFRKAVSQIAVPSNSTI